MTSLNLSQRSGPQPRHRRGGRPSGASSDAGGRPVTASRRRSGRSRIRQWSRRGTKGGRLVTPRYHSTVSGHDRPAGERARRGGTLRGDLDVCAWRRPLAEGVGTRASTFAASSPQTRQGGTNIGIPSNVGAEGGPCRNAARRPPSRDFPAAVTVGRRNWPSPCAIPRQGRLPKADTSTHGCLAHLHGGVRRFAPIGRGGHDAYWCFGSTFDRAQVARRA